MGYFAWPYRVLFSDAEAPRWHHFLSNFRFQCEAREHFLFSHVLDTAEARAECEDLVLRVHEGYSRNLAPVALGDTVGVLMSYEDVTPTSLRCCFRVVRSDGTPVSCGFQKLVSLSRTTGHVVAGPERLLRHAGALREVLWSPSFADRVVSGIGLSALFDEDVVRLGRETATGARRRASAAPSDVASARIPVPARLGNGPGRARLLVPRRAVLPPSSRPRRPADRRHAGNDAHAAPRRCRSGRPPAAASGAGGDRRAPGRRDGRAAPLRAGRPPEPPPATASAKIAAAVIAGSLGLGPGWRRLHRVTARWRGGGRRATGARRPADGTRALLGALAPSSVEISGWTGRRTIVSGRHGDLERLDALAAHFGIAITRPAGIGPVHSRLALPGVAPWAAALRGLAWKTPDIPVYSAPERGLQPADADLPALLASHLARPLQFHDALVDLAGRGGRVFVECGSGSLLTDLARSVLGGAITAMPTLPAAGGFAESLDLAVAACGLERPPAVAASSASRPPAGAASAPPEPQAPRHPGATPIAVVGLGCVLPGALDPDELWARILETATCLGDEPPYDARDFLSVGPMPVPDKTYAALGGWARGFQPGPEAATFATLTQQHLAAALVQCLAGIEGAKPAADRIQVLLGSTGDGCREYDDALLLASLTAPEGPRPSTCPRWRVGRGRWRGRSGALPTRPATARPGCSTRRWWTG